VRRDNGLGGGPSSSLELANRDRNLVQTSGLGGGQRRPGELTNRGRNCAQEPHQADQGENDGLRRRTPLNKEGEERARRQLIATRNNNSEAHEDQPLEETPEQLLAVLRQERVALKRAQGECKMIVARTEEENKRFRQEQEAWMREQEERLRQETASLQREEVEKEKARQEILDRVLALVRAKDVQRRSKAAHFTVGVRLGSVRAIFLPWWRLVLGTAAAGILHVFNFFAVQVFATAEDLHRQ